MLVRIMGCGTSTGVPVPGCTCNVCQSSDSLNKRMRSSLLIINDRNPSFHENIVIDTGPDFRVQAVHAGIRKVDAVLYTHDHADHLHGIDDLRPLHGGGSIPIYGSTEFGEEVIKRFPYIFGESFQKGGGKPRLQLHDLGSADQKLKRDGAPDAFTLCGLNVQPVPVMHGRLPILGYRIGNLGYITDCSYISEKSISLLQGISVLILGALRHKTHETHFSISEAIELVERIKPEKCIFTHLGHEVEYHSLQSELPPRILVGYDSMEFTI